MPVTDEEIEAAEAAIRNALNVRNHHKRRTRKGDRQREKDIKLALERLKEAMKPLRSAIGRFQYDERTEDVLRRQDEVRELSRCIQGQRRRLWKMQLHKERKA